MEVWKNSIVIHAPTDRVFAYVDAPMNMPEWLPGMVEVRNVIGTGAGQQYEWTYKMAGILMRGQAVVIEHVPGQCTMHHNIGTISAIWRCHVEPHEEGTLLAFELEYSIPIPLVGKLAEHIVMSRNEREFDLSLQNVKDAVEA